MSEENQEEDETSSHKKPRILETSEEAQKLTKEAFSSAMSNAARKETRAKAPSLGLPETRCPKLDSPKFSGSSEAKLVTTIYKRSKP